MDKVIEAIGQRIKELRLQKGLTLEEVSEQSGCTPGFLSQVERNKATPSISLMYALAESLETSVSAFFPETINAAKVVRHDARESFTFEGSSITYSLLTTKFPHSAIESFLLTVLPSSQALPTDETRTHRGEEFAYVLEGILRMWYGDTCHDLHPGDSIHFDPSVPHRMENPGNELATALWIITPAIF